jgi:AhpD family alkylhydroperoxidase
MAQSDKPLLALLAWTMAAHNGDIPTYRSIAMTDHLKRINLFTAAPNAAKGLLATSKYLEDASLAPVLVELVYLRVSLINGCAYCIDMHTRDLLAKGQTIDKLALLPVWDEAGALFDARERAALAWAESLTKVAATHAPDADYQQAAAVFSERELADLTTAIALMNALNRIGVGTRITPAAAKTAA